MNSKIQQLTSQCRENGRSGAVRQDRAGAVTEGAGNGYRSELRIRRDDHDAPLWQWHCILPQRPVLLTAKELMTLDHLCGGRFEFGVGAGWSAEEYEVLGVPFARRGRRFDEYIEAIRTAWRNNPASYSGEFISYENVVLMPQPLTPGGPPILIGGSSDAALKRAAKHGDGWFGHWTPNHDPSEEIARLRAALAAAGRAEDESFRVKASLVHADDPAALGARLDQARSLGVQEVVLIVPVRTRSVEADLELWATAAGLRS